MYAEYFGLKETSFSITPDPHYLFLSQQHREALAHLLYGIDSGGGFVLLTGEVGTGKTTVCRAFIEQAPEHVDIALVLNPCLSVEELLQTICQEFGIEEPPSPDSNKALLDRLNEFLLQAHAQHRKPVLMIDEAQNLSPAVLEQIRLLTNLETSKDKLLQIFLIGQPELREILGRQELRQLSQRITARYHLMPLSLAETQAYIQHRLAVAGVSRILFNRSAVKTIYSLSGGIPRLVNVLCDRALLGAYATGQPLVNKKIVIKAAAELTGEKALPKDESWLGWLAGLLLILTLAALAVWALNALNTIPKTHTPTPPAATSAAPRQMPSPTVSPAQILPMQDWQSSLKRILQLWGITETDSSVPDLCRDFPYRNLFCRYRNGQWQDLQRYNRPVILKLSQLGGKTAYLTLESLAQDHFVSMGKTLPRNLLDKLWQGEYFIFWRPAPGTGPLIRMQSSKAAIRWLNHQLDSIPGLPPAADPARYDASRVRAFQQQMGLKADGIAGPDTLILLNSRLHLPGIPHLLQN